MHELVLEHCRVEKRNCAPSRNAARAAHSPSQKPPPLAFLASRRYISRNRHPLAYPGSRASDGSWKEQPKLFQQLKILGSADTSARRAVFVTDKESPREIGKAMHSCPSSYESQQRKAL